jgi:hypothetical protein
VQPVLDPSAGGAGLLCLTEITGFSFTSCDHPVLDELGFLAGRGPDRINVRTEAL